MNLNFHDISDVEEYLGENLDAIYNILENSPNKTKFFEILFEESALDFIEENKTYYCHK